MTRRITKYVLAFYIGVVAIGMPIGLVFTGCRSSGSSQSAEPEIDWSEWQDQGGRVHTKVIEIDGERFLMVRSDGIATTCVVDRMPEIPLDTN